MGAKLAAAGIDTVVVERGAQQRAITERGGIRLLEPQADPVDVPLRSASIPELPPQDLVILGVKAMDIAKVATQLGPILGSETAVMTVQNGIPWWYFQRNGGPHEDHRLLSLDPDGVIETHIEPARIIACVAYAAVDITEPGVVRLVSRGRFPVGELDGSTTDRVQAIHDVFEEAGLRSRILEDVRAEIWLKAWGSLSFNPISALTRSTMEEICRDPATRHLVATMMREAEEIAHRLGITFRRTIEERIAGAEKVGAHKTSMLQDAERGENMEVDALISVMSELGRLTDVATPTIDTVQALVSRLHQRIAVTD